MVCVLSFPLASFPTRTGKEASQGSMCRPNNPFVSAVCGRLIEDSGDKLQEAPARSPPVNILSLAKLTDGGVWLLQPCDRQSPSANKEMWKVCLSR